MLKNSSVGLSLNIIGVDDFKFIATTEIKSYKFCSKKLLKRVNPDYEDAIFFTASNMDEFMVNSIPFKGSFILKNEKYHKFEGGTMQRMIKEM